MEPLLEVTPATFPPTEAEARFMTRREYLPVGSTAASLRPTVTKRAPAPVGSVRTCEGGLAFGIFILGMEIPLPPFVTKERT